jgi:hypothetical protein
MSTVEVGRTIHTTRKSRKISIDEWERGEIYVSIRVSGGSTYCSITLDQAREMINALEALIEHTEANQ